MILDTLEKHRYAGVFSGDAFLRLCQWREIPEHKRSAEQPTAGPEGVSVANNPGMTSDQRGVDPALPLYRRRSPGAPLALLTPLISPRKR